LPAAHRWGCPRDRARFAPRRVRCVLRVPKGGDGRAVQDRRLVRVQHQHRGVRRGGVELGDSGQLLFGELRAAPAAHDAYPLAGRRTLCLLTQHPQPQAQRWHPFPAQLKQVVHASADEVDVRVIESGDHAAPERVDHAGTRPGQGSDVGLVADGGDAPCGYGERGGLRPGGIPSEDPAVPQDQIGRSRRPGRCRGGNRVEGSHCVFLSCWTRSRAGRRPGCRAFGSAARVVRFTSRPRPGG